MPHRQLPFDLGHRPALSRDDFWISSSNRDAVEWVDRWPAWPAPALVIHGPAASGKTHLLHVWQQAARAFVYTAALAAESGIKTVAVDDADKIVGDRAAEENLLHLYNALKETGGQMLLTAAQPPQAWPFVLPDLKSRLMSAPTAALSPPDDQLMAVVLSKLFSDRQIFVSQEVVQFILTRAVRSLSVLRDLVEAIDHRALAEKRPVTIPLVRDVMQARGL